MDRNRDARRATMAATNGLPRRRHRSSSLRDSPEDDGPVELQETSRLRDRGSGKKDRDRDRDRDRERERDRDRDRDRLSRSKRRRGGERLMHGSIREDGEDSSEESVNDEDEDEDDDGGGSGGGGGGGGGSIRMLPPNPSSVSMSSSALLTHRKSFPPVNNKHFRALPALKVTNEMICVSVPRKARSASTKRSHEWPSSCGVVGDQIHRQATTSPVRPGISAMPAPAPTSPSSSSHASVRKKLKPNGPKLRPPKMSSTATKSSSSAQEEIIATTDEIEIAEVLYKMMRQPQGPSKQEIIGSTQPQGPSKQEFICTTDSIKFESRGASDAKSRVSSPISNSPCAPTQLTSSAFPQNSSSSVTSMSAVAPKRKRPRPVKYDDENPSIFTVQNSPIKMVTDQPAKIESSSPNLEKNQGSAAENGGFSYDLANSHGVPASSDARPQSVKPESNNSVSDSKPANDESESQNVKARKEEPQSPKKESSGLRLDDNREEMTVTKANSTMSGIENQREEKFQIDLMAPPPLRSSPERDCEVDFGSVDPKPTVIGAETEIKPMSREEGKALKIGKEEPANVETEKCKALVVEEAEFKKPIVGVVGKERNIDLQLDLEKSDRDSGNASFSGNKLLQHVTKQQQQQSTEKTVNSSSVPLPMSVASWPGGLSSMGYMAPLQGVVSMDGSTVSSTAIQPPHLLFNQPRPKRCATHCYIARNIYYHQQIARMNPFWPVAAGGGSLYGGPKHCNPNVLPSELHGNIPGRVVNSAQDKGQGLAMFPGQSGKEKVPQAVNLVDAAQRKQIVLQQALPQGAPSNILHGPAFIFPLSQQQAAAAASVRPGSVKSSNAGSAASSSASNSASMSAAVTAGATPAMSFNYPNMPGNEPQYLAILQNSAYPFPMPTHVGAPPAYRGPHAQMPYFNGSFYPSQMLHPSHLQQQQQPASQSQQSQQGHQNPSLSSGSSSSQKHLQNQQQRPHAGGVNGGSGSLQGFPASKNQSSQTLQLQHQRQQQQNPHAPHQGRQLEPEMGGEDSPSTADSRVSRANMSIYGPNFAMPMHPPNFAVMTAPSIGSANGTTGASGSEKKQQQQQQQGSKAGVEASQAFAMSFASLNGASSATGLDISSIAQNHAILQNFPEFTKQGYHPFIAVAAAAQAAQQKKNYRVPEEGKTGGDSSNVEEERKAMAGKASSTVGHSIAFSRPDLTDTSTMPGNNVIDSSARSLNLSSAPVRASSSVMPAAPSTVNAPTPQQQLRNHLQQQQQQQQQQLIQLQKQQFSAAARSKTPATSNGSVFSDHLPSTSSMAAKFPNALSSFPQNLVHSSSSPAQSPQWKNSARTTTSQVSSSSLASSTSSSLKNLPQKHGRTQQSHTQISFAANPKSSTQSQGIQPASSHQSPSPQIMVGSPTTTPSSMSKSAGGSPRTTTNTTGNKAGQAASLSSQQAKNSPSVPTQKSSPVGGRNVPSILGNTHITSSSTGTKPQLQQHQQQQHHQQNQQHQQHQQHQQQQQQQQQLSKQSIQQAQLFYSNSYMQPQVAHSNSATSTASPSSGYYHLPRRRPELQQPQGSSGTSSSGMLSLCPVTHANTSTTDPAKAVAAAAANMKGSGLSSQTLIHAQFAAQSSGPHQLVPAGFPYVHTIPTVVQVKPAEQKKQPAGD